MGVRDRGLVGEEVSAIFGEEGVKLVVIGLVLVRLVGLRDSAEGVFGEEGFELIVGGVEVWFVVGDEEAF